MTTTATTAISMVMVSTTTTAAIATAATASGRSSHRSDFFSCRIMHVDYLSFEMQSFTCQRMIEIHDNYIITYFQNRTIHPVSV